MSRGCQLRATCDAGIRIFDTSLGGMSATPYGKQMDVGCWNVPTEDLVHLFEEMASHGS